MIVATGFTLGIDRFDQHREQAKAIASQDVGEDPIAHKSHLIGR